MLILSEILLSHGLNGPKRFVCTKTIGVKCDLFSLWQYPLQSKVMTKYLRYEGVVSRWSSFDIYAVHARNFFAKSRVGKVDASPNSMLNLRESCTPENAQPQVITFSWLSCIPRLPSRRNLDLCPCLASNNLARAGTGAEYWPIIQISLKSSWRENLPRHLPVFATTPLS